ncbi:MAG: FadR family transcriptional regulator [Lentisphaerae bacterium]|nr:FadR family transcriptional regulator [Lentisphaerota bacterium]MCP4100920.1 FadR family transcriptional regulator [Lentisphaerota bacterium]
MKSVENNGKVYKYVADQIQGMILNGNLKRGDKLPTERTLAEKFRASRNSVREALRALEILGIIECRQGGGNYISHSFAKGLVEPLSIMAKLCNASINELMRMRLLLEVEALRTTASIATNALKLQFKELCWRLANEANEEKSLYIDQEFHSLIVNASGNEMLIALFNAFDSTIRKLIREGQRKIGHEGITIEELSTQHQKICDAIVANDPQVAQTALRAHLKFFFKELND